MPKKARGARTIAGSAMAIKPNGLSLWRWRLAHRWTSAAIGNATRRREGLGPENDSPAPVRYSERCQPNSGAKTMSDHQALISSTISPDYTGLACVPLANGNVMTYLIQSG